MRNMFGILKISLFGIFILLISTQTFAACEAELEAAATAMGRDMPGDSRPVQTRIQDNLTRFNQEMREGEAAAKRGNLGQKQEFQRMLAFNNSRVNDSDSRTRLSSKYGVCKFEYFLSIFGNESTNSNQNQSSASQQAQQRARADEQSRLSLKEQTENTLLADGAQQRAQNSQKNADESRKGKRRRHEPENEASHCIQPDFGGLYGGMKNTCNFKVWYTYCGYRPSENSWLSGMNCEKQSFGSDSVSPGRTSASHTKGVQMLYWIACKEPAWTVDTEFVAGSGIRGRCHTVGGN